MRRNASRGLWALAGLCVWLTTGVTGAMPLDPRDFPSLGLFPGGSPASINTDTLTLTSGSTVLRGTTSGNVAVFDFDAINAGGIVVTGSRPLALLSRSDALLTGTLFASAGLPNFGTAGAPGPGGYGPGSGPGAGGEGGSFNSFPLPSGGFVLAGQGAGGGGFGGAGGAGGGYSIPGGGAAGGAGGGPYGDLLQALQGGSGGGGAGGAGGGAVELGALGTITVSSTITVDGGKATGLGPSVGGGGGGGGGILLHADAVRLLGLLSAGGGAGLTPVTGNPSLPRAIGGSGGGGGGRVLIELGPGGFVNSGSVFVGGGPGSPANVNGPFSASPGSFGASGSFEVITVPEPSGWLLLGVGLLGLSLHRGWPRGQAAVSGGRVRRG